ncbi:MAG: hypothetical protein NT175_05795 [Bacteroidetes bacterium]|nr:hypothetical protein [Bacteroidota bacterium]
MIYAHEWNTLVAQLLMTLTYEFLRQKSIFHHSLGWRVTVIRVYTFPYNTSFSPFCEALGLIHFITLPLKCEKVQQDD